MHARSTHPMLLAVRHPNRKASPCSYTMCACAPWPSYTMFPWQRACIMQRANRDLTQPRDWYAGDPLLVDYGNWRVSL